MGEGDSLAVSARLPGSVLQALHCVVEELEIPRSRGNPRMQGPLRRLMCNSDQRRRSPDRMLHQTLSKGWCGHGSGLLLGLIVRPNRGLVEA
jgi:hypothetical protein